MDPLKLRLLNDATTDEDKKMLLCPRHFRECFEAARRNLAGNGARRRSVRCGATEGLWAGVWPLGQLVVGAAALHRESRFQPDGRVSVRSGTQDIGTGTYTIFAQVVQEKTGIPFDRIDVILGDSSLPEGPMSGGSMVTGSVLNAIAAASTEAMKKMTTLATSTEGSPLKGAKAEDVVFADGRIRKKDQSAGGDPEFADILHLAHLNGLSAEGKTQPTWEDPKAKNVSLHSYGAQFVEAAWEPEIARLRVSRRHGD